MLNDVMCFNFLSGKIYSRNFLSMDVDPPLPLPSLKRCCSAPMIAECESEKTEASQTNATISTHSTSITEAR